MVSSSSTRGSRGTDSWSDAESSVENTVQKLILRALNGELFEQKLSNFGEELKFQVNSGMQRQLAEIKRDIVASETELWIKVEMQVQSEVR